MSKLKSRLDALETKQGTGADQVTRVDHRITTSYRTKDIKWVEPKFEWLIGADTCCGFFANEHDSEDEFEKGLCEFLEREKPTQKGGVVSTLTHHAYRVPSNLSDPEWHDSNLEFFKKLQGKYPEHAALFQYVCQQKVTSQAGCRLSFRRP